MSGMIFTPEGNQRYLVSALAAVRTRLAQHSATEPEDVATPSEMERVETGDSGQGSTPLERLCETFGLSAFERDVLLLCAGADLDANFAAAIAQLQGGGQRIAPTFGLALATLEHPHWSALTPEAPLRRWRLIEVGAGATLTSSPLRVDERVLHYLAGIDHMDERLSGLIKAPDWTVDLTGSQSRDAAAVARVWVASGDAFPVVELIGEEPYDKQLVAAAACGLIGASLRTIAASAVPHQPSELDAFLRLWQRESALGRYALLVEWPDRELVDPAREAAILRILEHVQGPLLTTRRVAHIGLGRPVVTFDIGEPSAAERLMVWQEALGASAATLNGHLEALSARFRFGAPAIRAVCAAALHQAEAGADLGETLWQACRAESRPRLEDLAQRITSSATWDDLVLGEREKEILTAIAIQVRRRATVYDTWGFAAKGSRGLGISALFAGPSGTGKTMAAEVLANALNLDLHRIDLSQVVSKYIGETEKNLRRVFDAAEKSASILLFDEADALFGKRSEVKDSHDRFANVEISYLLQRMEAFTGLSILTTNMKHALDPAFVRRIRFVVHFPFPDGQRREEIWRRVFPIQTPVDALDYARLARLQVAGGSIRNIALNAAFLAAERGTAVRMVDVVAAARGEYGKLEQPLTEIEFGA